jgi:hypothetical protein
LIGCIFFGKEILLLRFRESLPPITGCALPAIAKDVIMRDTNTVIENVVNDKTARDLHRHAAEVPSQLVLRGGDRLGAFPDVMLGRLAKEASKSPPYARLAFTAPMRD